MSNVVDNLRNMPFSAIIGQPLKAIIEAQEVAALSTIRFIQEVGIITNTTTSNKEPFEDTTTDAVLGDVRNVTFKYKKNREGAAETVELSVPILTIVPIPFIRIASSEIDFKMKVSELVRNTTDKKVNNDLSIAAKYGNDVSLSISGSYSRSSTKTTNNLSTNHASADLGIKIHAVQEEIPAGLSRVLDILEATILEKPASS